MFHYLHGGGTTPVTTAEDLLGASLKSGGFSKYQEMGEGLTKTFQTIQSMDAEASKFVKTMGLTSQSSLNLKTNLNASYSQIVEMGGKMSDAVDQQENLFKVSGRNLVLFKDQSAELYAASSVTGIAGEKLLESFYQVGMEQAHVAETTFKIYDTARKMGVDAQAVSSTVTTNLDKLNRFGFVNGVEGLAKMAGKAQALKFDVKQTFELAESLMSPEKAIETAAAIQRLGGAATALTDPLKLMDLAQNNVEGLQDELGKLAKQYTFFDEKTQSFQIMKGARGQLKEVADALGIDRAEFEKLALSSANVAKKMSQIRFSGLDISDEDKEQLANLAQLKDVGGGRKEYFVNYFDKEGNQQSQRLADIGTEQLALIKDQNKDKIDNERDTPQERLIKLADSQLGEYGKLVVAQEKIANTLANTLGGSKLGEDLLKGAKDEFERTAKNVKNTFGSGSDFEKNIQKGVLDINNTTELLAAIATGDFRRVMTEFKDLASIAGSSLTDFVSKEVSDITRLLGKSASIANMNARIDTFTFADKSVADIASMVTIPDGFRTPVGDSLKTPTGTFDIYEKDYMLIATKLPEVLQKSSETGMKNVLKDKMSDISSIISSALRNNLNTNGENSQPQKQEVVHTVNFKVSVDTPRNKLSDMLIDELTKNTTVMQYFVKHFDNTKTSGGMIVKK